METLEDFIRRKAKKKNPFWNEKGTLQRYRLNNFRLLRFEFSDVFVKLHDNFGRLL